MSRSARNSRPLLSRPRHRIAAAGAFAGRLERRRSGLADRERARERGTRPPRTRHGHMVVARGGNVSLTPVPPNPVMALHHPLDRQAALNGRSRELLANCQFGRNRYVWRCRPVLWPAATAVPVSASPVIGMNWSRPHAAARRSSTPGCRQLRKRSRRRQRLCNAGTGAGIRPHRSETGIGGARTAQPGFGSHSGCRAPACAGYPEPPQRTRRSGTGLFQWRRRLYHATLIRLAGARMRDVCLSPGRLARAPG